MPGLLKTVGPSHSPYQAEFIRVRVQVMVGSTLYEEIPFRVRPTITVGQFLIRIAAATDLDVYDLQFFRGDEPVDHAKTVEEIGVEDGDKVKVLLAWD